MKPGDMVRATSEMQKEYRFLLSWDDLPSLNQSMEKINVRKFNCTDIGIVLEQMKIASQSPDVLTKWVKVLCSSSGYYGWIRRCDLVLVK